ncbi:hypothetical protein ACX12M_02975 [Cellulosimicrobium cellulans]
MADRPCTHGWPACGRTPTRRYMNAHLCAEHAPRAPRPPVGTTAAELRATPRRAA